MAQLRLQHTEPEPLGSLATDQSPAVRSFREPVIPIFLKEHLSHAGLNSHTTLVGFEGHVTHNEMCWKEQLGVGAVTGRAVPLWEVWVLAFPLHRAPQTCLIGAVSPGPAYSQAHSP